MESSIADHEQTIHDVAARRLGTSDASIVRHFARSTPFEEAEAWFTLFVRLPGDNEWTLIGRRRTKAELLALVETIDPRHVGGRDFRSCPGSPRPLASRLGATGAFGC